jgi:hypothetical protein
MVDYYYRSDLSRVKIVSCYRVLPALMYLTEPVISDNFLIYQELEVINCYNLVSEVNERHTTCLNR